MKSITRPAVLLAACSAAVFGILRTDLLGYALEGPKWATTQVSYFVNPQNIYVSDSAAISALQNAAVAWTQQTGANIQLVYGGQTSGSTFSLNGKNEVFFRNTTSSAGYAGETSWWYDYNNHLTEFDIAFYEGAYLFFTGGSGCSSNGVYLDDLAIHEFGHALGLGHSSAPGATMEPSLPSYCDLTQLTLEADDIAAIQALYPGSATVQPPSAPSQLGASPTATSPTSSLTLNWTDSSSNEDGYRVERSTDAASFTQVAQLGPGSKTFTNNGLGSATTYYYRVYAYNAAGVSAFSNMAAGQTQATAPTTTPAPPTSAPSSPTLSARAYKTKGLQNVDLAWSGFSATSIDVYRNGSKISTTANDGAQTDAINKKGAGSYSYKVCAAGTTTCSNSVTVSF